MSEVVDVPAAKSVALDPTVDQSRDRGGMPRPAREFLRYLVVGGTAFAVDFAFLVILTESGIYYLVSAAISFLLGLLVNYWLGVRWVFESRNLARQPRLEFTVYSAVGIVGLGWNELLLWMFTSKMGIFYVLSKVMTAAFVLVWNFLARKLLLFR